ncbi:hypothetical protein RRF57_003040 [Xylaria bambusicola]|uniref:DUF6546 domain-containing protein n=1 Tax=Xylaria bambusicola TaxID=326684 RepID=A0AAN7U834_9PEZI
MCFSEMRTRSETRQRSSWSYLPPEIRLMILETIAQQKNPGWAPNAAVCREWQYTLEKFNFRKLNLRLPCPDDFQCLENFQHIATTRRELIRHICLNVELPRYTPNCCSEGPAPSVMVSSIVSRAIQKLCTILSTWESEDDLELALEFNVYDPNDCEHWFKGIYLSSDDVEDDEDKETMIRRSFHDPRHGWLNGQHALRFPSGAAKRRLFQPIHLVFRKGLPRVKAVTRLIIRRQLRRCFSPKSLALLLGNFGGLEHISYEPWVPYHRSREVYQQVFEDSHHFYQIFRSRPDLTRPFQNLFGVHEMPEAVFADKSLDLEHLAISFIVNAEQIFRCCNSQWTWPHLQSVALTSEILCRGDRPNWVPPDWKQFKSILNLLHRAGTLAQQMPKLHTFVIWNWSACAFIYHVKGGSASVTWRGTCLLKLSPRVVESWQLAAWKLFRREIHLQIYYEHIQQTPITSHGDAVHYLRLPCQVVEPASLWQIRREGCIGSS